MRPAGQVPPLTPSLELVRAALVLLFIVCLTLLLQLVVISSLQHSSSQGKAFAQFRANLAEGTVPIGPSDAEGREVADGVPVAYLEIPSIGLKEVVGQGTSPSTLFKGPGHRRDTSLPGQVGSSIIFGRKAAFGGPFSDIDELKAGAVIKVTTGQGVFNYHVLDVRHEGDVAPPAPAAGSARLLLVTAAGSAFLPSGVLRVDADIDGQTVVGPAPVVSASALPAQERAMASDTRTLWALALWMQLLIGVSMAAVWAWHRWGHAQAWVIFLPPLLLVGLFTSGEAIRVLPNLL
ncbi:MAG: class sortase [Ilumatobacteraceae bacterium]|nr:class sortase [Ilumatobacteraceae bacterium]